MRTFALTLLLLTPILAFADDSPQGAASAPTNTDTQWKEDGAQATYDGSVYVTGAVTVGKFIENIAVSTPSAPASNHFRVFFSSGSNALCGETSAGTVTCYSASSSPAYFQAVQTKSNTATTTTSNSFQACTNQTVTITPTSASHRVKVTVHTQIAPTATASVDVTIKRNSTELSGTSQGFMNVGPTNTGFAVAFSYIDSPATTSATTYAVYFENDSNSNTVTCGSSGVSSVIIAEEIL